MELRETSIGGQSSAIVELPRFKVSPHPCSYLPNESASLEYRIILKINPEAYEELLKRNWRRFGMHFFRPACPQCSKCTGIRILALEFSPNKSQRRTLKLNQDIEVRIGPASVSPEHIQLINAYHTFMHSAKKWPLRPVTEREYGQQFLQGDWEFAKEFQYYKAGKLVGVGLVDVLPNAISSVYFYHEPALRHRSLGVYSMLKEMEYAKTHNLAHQYLGYWIPECRSLAYKSQYKPHEFLSGYPSDQEEPKWVSAL